MIIRKAAPEEYPQVLEFYYAVSESMADSPWRPTWRRNVYPVLEDLVGDLFIAEQEGEGIVGAILVNDRQGEGYEEGLWSVNTDQVAVTHLLAVSAAHRGEGIARGLLSRARESVRGRAKVIRLDTLVNNRPAKRLYEGFGFRASGDMAVECESVGVKQFTLYEYVL